MRPADQRKRRPGTQNRGRKEGSHRWELFRDSRKGWRWLQTNPDGITVAVSSQAFTSAEACLQDLLDHAGDEGDHIYFLAAEEA